MLNRSSKSKFIKCFKLFNLNQSNYSWNAFKVKRLSQYLRSTNETTRFETAPRRQIKFKLDKISTKIQLRIINPTFKLFAIIFQDN